MVHDGLPRKTVFCFVTKSPSDMPRVTRGISHGTSYAISYTISYTMSYTMSYAMSYTIFCVAHLF